MNEIRAIRGMNDILPQDTAIWQFLERQVAAVLDSYGFGEIRLPVVEKTALFNRSIGEVTDIVEKEMYTFDDRNGDSMTLRPEGTAGCVRAAIQQSLLATPQRLWYCGPMFRYERPQRGRQRQFHQIGVECLGFADVGMDAELIAICARLWRQLGMDQAVTLEINSIGSASARAGYRDALTRYLQQHIEALDEDSRRRLGSNPLRILDSKHPETQALLNDAPSLTDYIDEESARDFDRLCAMLDAMGIAFAVNPRLVRGLDYYNKTVFEWVTTNLGAQGTVCAGGRYDTLIEQLGGRPTPAVGCAMGMERLVLLLQELGMESEAKVLDIYAVAVGEVAELTALSCTEQLRDSHPQWKIQCHRGGGSFKSQMKKADKSGAAIALVWGEDEVAANTVNVKPLRQDAVCHEQRAVPRAELENTLAALLTGIDKGTG